MHETQGLFVGLHSTSLDGGAFFRYSCGQPGYQCSTPGVSPGPLAF
jgi:hypothetical protein